MQAIYLNSGDMGAFICPGSVCPDPESIHVTQNYMLNRYGFDFVYAKDCQTKTSPQERAEIILNYLFDANIKLIAPLYGGEGTADILPYLHEYYADIKKIEPKFIIGLSDITALLLYFEKHYGWPVIHGPSARQFALRTVDEKTEKSTMDFLRGFHHPSALENLMPLNDCAKETQLISANMVGGNLSTIAVSIKDLWEIETANKIIFFEDIGEKAHKLMRNLKYFSRIGLFKQAKAIILGDFTSKPVGCTPAEQEINHKTIFNSLSSFAHHHPFLPILYSPDIGHGKRNLPLVLSTTYNLTTGIDPKLSWGGGTLPAQKS